MPTSLNTVDVVFESAMNGIKTGRSSFGTLENSKDGMTRRWKWIVNTTTEITSRVISALLLTQKTSTTDKIPVYDLLNAGPRHCFTILTSRGPLIVHNSMGWEKFQATVYADEGIWLEDEFCQMVVKVYRKDMYPEIPALWNATGKAAIGAVQEGGTWNVGGDALGIGGVSYFMSGNGNFLHCCLPSGRHLAYLYPEVHIRVSYRFAAINEHGKPTMVMFPAKKNVPMHRVRWHAEKLAAKQHKKLLGDAPESFLSPHLSFMGRDTYTKQWKRCGTHGGSLVENYDQASSRDLLAEAMLRIDELPEFDLLISIHDEVIAEAAKGTCNVREFEDIMSVVPGWAQGMPVTAEGWIGPRLRK
jgi:DNA polymerase